ncbi:MAG: hypothetical protein ACI87E_004463 [Mariniblastus sp.]|jgi:hypothetical protein
MSKQISTSSTTTLSACSLLMLLVISAGCKGNGFTLAPVSGTVTVDGAPVPDLNIAFYPKGTEENPAPGPFSTGKTDSAGQFTLVSRGGEKGAVVGLNRVGFELPGNFDEAALENAYSKLEELMGMQGSDPAEVKAAKANITKIKKQMKGFAMIPAHYLKSSSIELEVPPEGLTDYAFELNKQP